MARIFLGIAIVLTLITSFFSFQTKSKISEIREELDQAKNASTQATTAHKKAQEEAQALTEQVTAANTAKESADAALAAAKAEAEKAGADLAAIQSQISVKDTEIESLKTQLATAAASTTTEAEPASSELENKVKELEAQVQEQKQVAQALESKNRSAEQKIAELSAEQARRQAGVNAPGLEGKVLVVDPSWNFVVLSIGDRQGVAPNSTLLVKRGRSLIARVKVTSVDPSTSIADVVPGSIPKGSFIRPGDTVIYSGS